MADRNVAIVSLATRSAHRVGEWDRDAGDQWGAADPGPFLVGEVLLGRHGHLLQRIIAGPVATARGSRQD